MHVTVIAMVLPLPPNGRVPELECATHRGHNSLHDFVPKLSIGILAVRASAKDVARRRGWLLL